MENLTSSLREIWDGFVASLGGYLPGLAKALAILIIGWLVALIVARLLQAALRRTELDNKIASLVRGEGEPVPEVETGVGRVAFWLVMILVLVAFFDSLDLPAVTGPLNSFLTQIAEFLPRLGGAALLLLVAWLLATGLRMVVRAALQRIDLDRRIGSKMAAEGEAEADAGADAEADAEAETAPTAPRVSLSSTLSETVYWLVFLLFLPLVLGTLELTGLLEPINAMVSKVLAFLPNILVAVAFAVGGWFLAKILQRIVSNLLAAMGLDRIGEEVGLSKALGRQKLSGLVGVLVQALVMIPVLIAALNALDLEDITEPASAMLGQILGSLPALFGALILMTLAYVIARIVAGLVTNVLRAAGLGRFLQRLGFSWDPESGRASEMVGHLVVVAILLFAAIEALELLGFGQLAALVSAFILFLGNVLLGLVIFGLGLYLANLAATTISASGSAQAGILATAARAAILILAGAMALGQMNVGQDIIKLTFGLLLGAVAVAVAVAFGIGGRDLARDQLERWSESLRRRSGG